MKVETINNILELIMMFNAEIERAETDDLNQKINSEIDELLLTLIKNKNKIYRLIDDRSIHDPEDVLYLKQIIGPRKRKDKTKPDGQAKTRARGGMKRRLSPAVKKAASACGNRRRRKKKNSLVNTTSQNRTSRGNVGNLNSVRTDLGLQPTVTEITQGMENLNISEKKGGKLRKRRKRTRRKKFHTKKRKSKNRRKTKRK